MSSSSMPTTARTLPADEFFRRARGLWRLEQGVWTLWAVSWLLAWGAALTFALTLADELFRYHDAGLRWFSSFGWVAGWSIAAVIWWARLRSHSPPDLIEWAERSELLFPRLGSRLSSAVAFLNAPPSDPLAGSTALRAALVEQVADEARDCRLSEALPRRAAFSALCALAVTASLGALFCAAGADDSRHALARLVRPWDSLPWPQRDQLIVVEAPHVVPRGAPMTIRVRNRRGRLPATVRFLMRLAPQTNETQASVATYLMNLEGEQAVLQLDSLSRSFEFRVAGGDDDTMPWRSVTVVDLPRWRESRRLVVPPTYTRLPSHQSPAAIRAVEGSFVVLSGKTTRAVAQVELITTTDDSHLPIGLKDATGKGIEWRLHDRAWQLRRSGNYRVRITDQAGLTWTTEPAPVEVQSDAPPSIVLTNPAEPHLALPTSTILIRGEVQDDLGLAEVSWRIETGERELHSQTLPLGQSHDQTQAPATQSSIEARPKLPSDLAPETEVTIHVGAVDTLGQTTSSTPIVIRIVTRREFDRVLRRLQDRIALQLAQAADNQQQALSRVATASASPRTQDVPTLLDHARRTQTLVSRLIGEEDDSARSLATDLLELFELHPLGDSKLREMLLLFLDEVDRTALARQLQIDRLWPTGTEQTRTAEVLKKIRPLQRAQQDWLEQWAARWSRQRDTAELRHELEQIRQRQASLHQTTEELRAEAMVNPSRDLQDTLERQAQRQKELQREWERWRARAADVLSKQRNVTGAALEQIDDLEIGPKMDQAARYLRQQRSGLAGESQQQVAERLEQSADLLAADQQPRQPDAKNRAATRTGAFPAQVDTWARRQSAILRDSQKLEHRQTPDQSRQELVQQQQRLRQQIAAESGEQQLHPALQMLFDEVVDRMSEAETALKENEPTDRVVGPQTDALELLTQLAQSLQQDKKHDRANKRRQPTDQQANPSRSSLPPAAILKLLQGRLLEKTQQLDRSRRRTGLTPQLARQIQQLAVQQGKLANWIEQAIAPPEPSATDDMP